MISIVIVTVWRWAGYFMVIFIAALESISPQYYEAANLDSATAWQRFRYVTLPFLYPTIFFVSIKKKALVYKAAAELCDVHIFRNSPFFFEIKSGRIRNSSQSGFPPGPGLEGWYMRKNACIPSEFQEWIKPYKEADLIWADIFSDFAHYTVGYDVLLEKGLKGISEDALKEMQGTSDTKKIEFYSSVIFPFILRRHSMKPCALFYFLKK